MPVVLRAQPPHQTLQRYIQATVRILWLRFQTDGIAPASTRHVLVRRGLIAAERYPGFAVTRLFGFEFRSTLASCLVSCWLFARIFAPNRNLRARFEGLVFWGPHRSPLELDFP